MTDTGKNHHKKRTTELNPDVEKKILLDAKEYILTCYPGRGGEEKKKLDDLEFSK